MPLSALFDSDEGRYGLLFFLTLYNAVIVLCFWDSNDPFGKQQAMRLTALGFDLLFIAALFIGGKLLPDSDPDWFPFSLIVSFIFQLIIVQNFWEMDMMKTASAYWLLCSTCSLLFTFQRKITFIASLACIVFGLVFLGSAWF